LRRLDRPVLVRVVRGLVLGLDAGDQVGVGLGRLVCGGGWGLALVGSIRLRLGALTFAPVAASLRRTSGRFTGGGFRAAVGFRPAARQLLVDRVELFLLLGDQVQLRALFLALGGEDLRGLDAAFLQRRAQADEDLEVVAAHLVDRL